MILLFGVLMAFVGGASVAGVSPEQALHRNPAALFGFRGWSVSTTFQESQTWQGEFLYHLGSFAAGYTRDRSWLLGGSVALRPGLRLGARIAWSDQDHQWRPLYGLLYRARTWGIGATATRLDRDAEVRMGLALRPASALFFAVDGVFSRRADAETWVSAGLRIWRGMWLHGNARWTSSTFDQVSVGLDLSLGHLRLGVQQDRQSQKALVQVSMSPDRYPSALPVRRYLKIKLQGALSEDRLSGLFSTTPAFTDLLLAIQRAIQDPSIRGIYVQIVQNGLSYSQTEELRATLEQARAAGKPVIVYAEGLGLKDAYLASVANQVLLAPTGYVFLPGLVIRRLYFTGLLEKLGMSAEFERIAEYKSAVEPFTRKEMSPEDREQLSAYLQDLLTEVVQKIRDGRAIDSSRLEAWMDTLVYIEAEDAQRLGLVDTVLPPHRVSKFLKDQWGRARAWSWVRYSRPKTMEPVWAYEKPQIVVLTLEGGIVTGESGSSPIPILGGKFIGSSAVVRALMRLKNDSRVKGVVLRINSPGGSALASELMWRAIRDVMEKKPVVVSMGAVAASGGYYISATGAKIVADRTTLTGSIGILGGKIVMKDFYEEKLGITSDTIKSHPHADLFSEWRSFTPEERKGLMRLLRKGYETFLSRVSDGRGLPVDSIDAIGRGHIWSGQRAKDLGLVDRIGTVLDAIAWVREMAKVGPEAEIRLMTTQKARMPMEGLWMRSAQAWNEPWQSWAQEPVLYWLPPLKIEP